MRIEEDLRRSTPVSHAIGAQLRPPDPALAADARRAAVLRGFACLVATWALLSAATTLLGPWLGKDWALVAALALAIPPLAWVAYRHDQPRWTWADLEPCAFAVVLGVFLLPLIFFHVAMPELFDPLYRLDHPAKPQPPATWLALGLLGPVLQEFLHRKLLLEALARQLGSVIALVLASALYVAAPVASWSHSGTAAAAVLFGILMLTGKSVPLCAGMHVGFNLAALWTGIRVWEAPLPLVALPPPLLALAGLGLVLAYGYAFGTGVRRAALIAAIVAGAGAARAGDDDYIRYVAFRSTVGKESVLLRWHERQMPLRVYLTDPPEGLFENPKAVRESVRSGIVDWTDVVKPGVPSFTFVDEIGDADIPVVWETEPVAGWFVAHTALDVNVLAGRFGVSRVLVTGRWRDRIASPTEIYEVVLHEIGHALGLGGHSPDPGDIMHSSAFVAPGLSERDRRTLQLLYKRPIRSRVTGAKRQR